MYISILPQRKLSDMFQHKSHYMPAILFVPFYQFGIELKLLQSPRTLLSADLKLSHT